MTEEQKQHIADAGRLCEAFRAHAMRSAERGDVDDVAFYVETARELSQFAFQVARS